MWETPQLKHTWVLNNSETAIGLTIRQLVDMRDAEVPRDTARQDIKGTRTLMKKMRLDSKGSGISPPPMPIPQEQQNRQHMLQGMAAPPYNDANMADMQLHNGENPQQNQQQWM